jgi:serine/threonine-protein kinase
LICIEGKNQIDSADRKGLASQPPVFSEARAMTNLPAAAAVCSACGEQLGAKGECFACLLRAGFDEADQSVAPEAAAVFDDFEITRHEDGSFWELGHGAMGVTYRATEKTLHRSVALKVIETHGSEAVRERFLREACVAAALRHPNVASVFHFGESANTDRCYCAMELIEGETLDALVRRVGPLSLELALEIAIQVTRALVAAAGHGLVHRDLKPGNIMLTHSAEGVPAKIEIKVIDFGLTKAASDVAKEMELTHGEFVGTPAFASPEQFAGGSLDARSDIYALGVTLWFALTRRLPFAGRTIEEIRERQRSERLPLEQLQEVPRRVIELLRSCLAANPAKRPASARELMMALELCRDQSVARRRTRKLAVVAAIAVLGSVVALVVSSLTVSHRASPTTTSVSSKATAKATSAAPAFPEKSIAVLPFENLSAEKENAYFADGVQDEILTLLARIADLKIISRVSVMQYKSGVVRNLREIGQQLGVANVVEGSVQRSGNRVRVNAKLVDARTDRELWGQTYDRDLADVFAIQSEIAKAIAEQLQAKLLPGEGNAIERPPTADIAAFDLYTQGKNLLLTSFSSAARAKLLAAADLLNEAIGHDPSFFQAYCQLAHTHDLLYFLGLDHTPARLASAEAAVQAAARLRPDAGETHLARAENLYWGHRDYGSALAELEVARQNLPNDPRIFHLTGLIQRRQGLWEESTQNLERAVDLDPRNFFTLQQIAISYGVLRRYGEDKSVLDRALAIEPNNVDTKVALASVEFHWKADTRPLHRAIDSIRATNPGALPSVANDWLSCALAERDIAAARNALDAFGETPLTDYAVHLNRPLMEGIIARMTKDEGTARAAFMAARAEQEKTVRAQPDYGPALCVLGLIDAALRRKEEALREGRHAVELLPVEKDAINGPLMITYLAMIAAWADDKDLACEKLAITVRTPSTVSYGQLKLLPFWDPLRGDPRFEKIVASLAPK